MSSLVYRFALWMLLCAAVTQAQAGLAPLVVTSSGAPGLAVTLAWTPSPSPSVSGYFLNWGIVSGQCTNQLDVGNVTTTTLSGLSTNVNYFFNVVAYDPAGDQAPPSNELAYPAPVALTFQVQGRGAAATVNVSFQGNGGSTYVIQATQDFQHWVTLCTTNCVATGPVIYVANDPGVFARRFYRVGRQ